MVVDYVQGVSTSGVGMDLVIRSAGDNRVVANTYDSNAPFNGLGTWTTRVLAGGSYRLEYWPSYVSGGQIICGTIESVPFTVLPPPTPTPTPTPLKLAKPEIARVEPMTGRQVRMVWAADVNANRFEVKRMRAVGTTPSAVQCENAAMGADPTTLECIINLDEYLVDTESDLFTVQAFQDGGSHAPSDVSYPVGIVVAPIKSMDGDSGVTLVVEWDTPPGDIQTQSLSYRAGGGGQSHTDEIWTPSFNPPKPLVTVNATKREHEITGLTAGTIYAVQYIYTDEDGIKTFAGRDSYGWTSIGQPAEGRHGLNDKGRVATYPYFGHWPDRTYRYRICDNSFPATDRAQWVSTIAAAARQWETATDNLVTLTRDGTASSNCSLGTIDVDINPFDPLIVPIQLRPYYAIRINATVNDVAMIDPPNLSPLNFVGFIDDVQSVCVSFAPACVISRAYGSSAQASTRLSDRGNGVDILFNQAMINGAGPPDDALRPPMSPIVMNRCGMGDRKTDRNGVDVDGLFPHLTTLHELGHALGTSGAFVPENVHALVDDRPAYLRGHPSIADSVMNYDHQVASVYNEPDCSPHPLDVLAIRALYRTID